MSESGASLWKVVKLKMLIFGRVKSKLMMTYDMTHDSWQIQLSKLSKFMTLKNSNGMHQWFEWMDSMY